MSDVIAEVPLATSGTRRGVPARRVDLDWLRIGAFYLVDQTVIIVVGFWLIPTDFGPLARFLLLVGTTAATCWAFYLTGREIPWLRPLIGLKLRTSSRFLQERDQFRTAGELVEGRMAS